MIDGVDGNYVNGTFSSENPEFIFSTWNEKHICYCHG